MIRPGIGYVVKLYVSMKSGLEGRNNFVHLRDHGASDGVSMKSGLEGRNNCLVVAFEPDQSD